jgi:hypothetical protein
MRRIWRNILIIASIAVGIVLIIVLMIRITPQPPEEEMKTAREALEQAEKFKADVYAKTLFAKARNYYDSAMVLWKTENQKFIYSRNYVKVAKYASLATKTANNAEENSISNSSNLKQKIKQKIADLTDLVTQNNDFFSTYPLSPETRNHISQGKMLLQEADVTYKKGLYLQSNRKLTDAEYLLTESYNVATSSLKNYFKSYSTWKTWADKAINESKKSSDYSIIIDKFSRKCLVYLKGVKKYEFTAELGKNWVGGKRVRGDQATPEGMYKITKKFEGSKTKYYKALLLDYPNDEDKERFRNEIASGSLPRNAKIGGLIEIHGNGGKGIDWTEGCIALTDREMDVVFNLVKAGTPVTIVGSLLDYNSAVTR